MRKVAAATATRVACCSAYAITGGLGGLRMRAVALLAERGATSVLLASHGGRVAHDDQGLELQRLEACAEAATCDSSESAAADARTSEIGQQLHPVVSRSREARLAQADEVSRTREASLRSDKGAQSALEVGRAPE